MSADQRLFFAAAGHHALLAEGHDNLAARHERDGERNPLRESARCLNKPARRRSNHETTRRAARIDA